MTNPDTFPCAKCGGESSDPEWCSECGAALAGASAVASAPSAPAPEDCPDCKTPRAGSARFCEICGHDFDSGTSGPISVPAPSPAAEPAAASIPSAAPAPAANPASVPSAPAAAFDPRPLVGPFDAVVTADIAAAEAAGMASEVPAGGERVFPLDLPENRIGRLRGSDLHPEVPVDDKAVSKRHAVIRKDAYGDLEITDLNSSNGTRLNGRTLAPGEPARLSEGDVVELGGWSKLTVRKR